MREVLFTDEEFPLDAQVPENAVHVQGVINNYAFHPERIAAHAADISSMLAELPDDFWSDRGGGMSFLNACMDRHGNHWAEHPTIEQLIVLGIATGQAAYSLPREMWSVMPGGLPYFSVTPRLGDAG